MLPIKRILHATDFSERSGYAFRVACALARDYKAQLIVLHVQQTPIVGYPDGIALTQPENYREEARIKLRQLQPTDPSIPMERLLSEGDPATAVVETAKEQKADLIVLGTHGWTGLTRLLMGSVAEGVVRRAPCPVLTVKMPFPTEAEKAPASPALEPARV